MIRRSLPLADGPVFLVTNEAYGFKTREEFAAVAPAGSQVVQILEPAGRNTAPAVALAALAARAGGTIPCCWCCRLIT
ncbi:MAG: hypothetical protein R3E68_19015 [Burkholderiaceae bacterium]